MKLPHKPQSILVQYIIRTAFALLIGVGVFLGIFFTHEITYKNISDSCFVPAFVLLTLGFFSLVNHFGGFDFARYASVTTMSFMRKNAEKPYEDLIDYKEHKNEERQFEGPVYVPYFIWTVLFLVPALVFYFI